MGLRKNHTTKKSILLRNKKTSSIHLWIGNKLNKIDITQRAGDNVVLNRLVTKSDTNNYNPHINIAMGLNGAIYRRIDENSNSSPKSICEQIVEAVSYLKYGYSDIHLLSSNKSTFDIAKTIDFNKLGTKNKPTSFVVHLIDDNNKNETLINNDEIDENISIIEDFFTIENINTILQKHFD